MDKISRVARSKNMALIKSKNTQPELILRKELYKLGFRYRIHYPLLGKPDVVFPLKKIAVFVNGCFWHTHKGCSESHIPKTNTHYWTEKFMENTQRDKKNLTELVRNGWKVFVFYECELEKNKEATLSPLLKYLRNN